MFKNIGRALAFIAGVASSTTRMAADVGALLAVPPRFRRQYRYWHLHPKGWNAPRAVRTGSPRAGFDVMTRQINRDQDRRELKRTRSNTVKFARAVGGRELLARQSRREKSGFYSGAVAIAYAMHNRCGRLRRQRRDDTGKWTSGNLVRWA